MMKKITIPIFILAFLLSVGFVSAYKADYFADRYAQKVYLQAGGATLDVGTGWGHYIVDFNGDGDLDLIYGGADGTIYYYENNGDNTFTGQGYLKDQLSSNIDVGDYAAPYVIDYNGDGYLDLIVGANDGQIQYHKNNGTNGFLYMQKLKDTANNEIDVGAHAAPFLIDYNGDGDLDLMTGDGSCYVEYWENDGSNRYAFVRNLKLTSGSNVAGTCQYGSIPFVVDYNGDGDLDLMVGDSYATSAYGYVRYFENNGSDAYTYVDYLKRVDGPDNGIVVDIYSIYYKASPSLIDFDKDGFLDLVLTDWAGYATFYKGLVVLKDTSEVPIDFGGYVGAFVTDYNGDGDLDLLIGRQDDGTIRYYENNGQNYYSYVDSLRDQTYAVISCSSNGMGHQYLIDYNGDGYRDLICGRYDGTISYYKNTGTNNTYQFQRYFQSNLANIDIGTYNVPEVVDLNKDGLLDLVMSTGDGYLYYYSGKAGGAINDEFTSQGTLKLTTGTAISVGAYSKQRMIDVNNDGYLDILTGVSDGTMRYYRNNGSAYFTLDYTFQAGAGTANLDVGDYTDVFALSYNGFNEMYVGELGGYIFKYFYPNNFNITIQDQSNNLMRHSKINISESGTSDTKIRSILNNGKLQTGLNFDKVFDISIETNMSSTRFNNSKTYTNTIWFKNVRSPDNITIQGNRKWVPESTISLSKNFTAGHVIPVEIHILTPSGLYPIGNLSIEDSAPTNARIVSNIIVEKLNTTNVYRCGVQPDNSTYFYIDKTDSGCSFLNYINITAGDHVRVSYRIRVAGPEAYTSIGETKNYTLPASYLRFDAVVT